MDNSELIYEYVEKLYNARSANIDNFNTRFASLLVVDSGLFKLLIDTHLNSAVALWFAAGCILFCILGFCSVAEGYLVDARTLCTDEYRFGDDDLVKSEIVQHWLESIDVFDGSIRRRSWFFNLGLACFFISFSICLFALAR